MDLAADADNHKAPVWVSPAHDTFRTDWCYVLNGSLGWLNPEYDPADKWMAKVALEAQRGARLLVLHRGSLDANWWWDYVWPNATNIYCVYPRIKFVGQKDVYPSALVLSAFNVVPLRWTPTAKVHRINWRDKCFT